MRTANRKTARPRRVSVADYLAMPEDGPRHELIYGELVLAAKPTYEHQDWLHCLGEVLRRWVREHQLGEVCFDIDMILDVERDLVYAPDLLFVAKGNERSLHDGRCYGPADLCIEILSPSDRPWVQKRKFADYETYGVRWYWTLTPDPTDPVLEEFESVGGKFVCRTEVRGDAWFAPGVFPGLVLRLPPLLEGDLKAAVKGKAKRLM